MSQLEPCPGLHFGEHQRLAQEAQVKAVAHVAKCVLAYAPREYAEGTLHEMFMTHWRDQYDTLCAMLIIERGVEPPPRLDYGALTSGQATVIAQQLAKNIQATQNALFMKVLKATGDKAAKPAAPTKFRTWQPPKV